MPYEMNKAQFEQVLSLPADERYRHFIAKVADWEELWTLRGPEGFVLLGDDASRECVPVWPHPDYAATLATGSWAATMPERLDLDTFLEKWIPGMTKDHRRVAVFPTPQETAVVVDPARLETDFADEVDQYE